MENKSGLTLYIGEKDVIRINEWRDDHGCTLKGVGTIGRSIAYTFTPNNSGVVTKVICVCGAELDYNTDYDCNGPGNTGISESNDFQRFLSGG